MTKRAIHTIMQQAPGGRAQTSAIREAFDRLAFLSLMEERVHDQRALNAIRKVIDEEHTFIEATILGRRGTAK